MTQTIDQVTKAIQAVLAEKQRIEGLTTEQWHAEFVTYLDSGSIETSIDGEKEILKEYIRANGTLGDRMTVQMASGNDALLEIAQRIMKETARITTTTNNTINWRDLIVTSEGETWGNLGGLVQSAPANLDSATWSDNGISEWPDFFLSAEGEDPDFDTPRLPVDWSGFGDAMRLVTGLDE